MVRIAGRLFVVAGLATLYVSIALVAFTSPPGIIYKIGPALAAAGCYLLIVALNLLPNAGEVTMEAGLGFACLPAAFICAFAASGDEVGLQLDWLIITVLFFPAIVGLFVQAGLAKRSGDKWRSKPEDSG
jgi:hypothetical protein